MMEHSRDVAELGLFDSTIAVRSGTESDTPHFIQLKENGQTRLKSIVK